VLRRQGLSVVGPCLLTSRLPCNPGLSEIDSHKLTFRHLSGPDERLSRWQRLLGLRCRAKKGKVLPASDTRSFIVYRPIQIISQVSAKEE